MSNSINKAGFLLFFILAMGCNEQGRLKMKAQMGNRRAMYEYGMDIWKHTSGRKDEVDEAIRWMTKAAEKGDTQAMYELGMILSGGGGTTDPNPKAEYWFRKGAEAGDRFCMITLAEGYRYGRLGLPVNKAEAWKWYDASNRARKPGEM